MHRLILSCLLLSFASSAAMAGEVGPNDFRISHVAADRDYDATSAAIVHNIDDDEYLLVWRSDDDTIAGMVDDHFEVWGQRLHPNLTLLGGHFRISTTGVDEHANYAVNDPEVVYNSTEGEYFVVWAGALSSGEMEIFGQRVEAGSGSLLGGNIQVSFQGGTGNLKYEVFEPDVAYSPAQNEYMVVWSGDATTIPLFDDDFEIFGQRLSATGSPIGSTLQISTTGPAHDSNYAAFQPAVTHDRTRDDYMVVWSADVISLGVQWEIYGQRINASDGVDVGAELWLSDASTSGNDLRPDVAYAPVEQEYLVVWSSDEDAAAGTEIYAQRFDVATGTQIGIEDFRLSFMGPDNVGGFVAQSPTVNWSADDARYVVSWSGIDDAAAGFEIYAQILDGSATPTGPGNLRLSDMGPEGGSFEARSPSVACQAGVFAVVWHGDDDSGELVEEEFEIHGQLVGTSTGVEILGDVLLTRMGLKHSLLVRTGNLVYNPDDNEYLVAWLGEKALQPLEMGVFVRRVDAVTGELLDSEDVRIDEDTESYPWNMAATYDPATHEYLVVWGDADSRLWAQRLDASTLSQTGPNDILISSTIPALSNERLEPDVLYCTGVDRYVVVWAEDRSFGDDQGPELYMQQLAPTGTPQFLEPFRMTSADPPGATYFEAVSPQMAYDAVANELLVVCTGFTSPGFSRLFIQRYDLDTSDTIGGLEQISERTSNPGPLDLDPSIAFNSLDREYLVAWRGTMTGTGESHVFLQSLDGSGAEIGADDLLLSDDQFFAWIPDVAFSPSQNEYLVAWGRSKDTSLNLAARRINANGVPMESEEFLLNDVGPVQASAHGAKVAHGAIANNYLVIWNGVTQPGPLEMMGQEVRGQLYEADTATAAPLPGETTVAPRILAAYPNPFSTRMQFDVRVERTRDVRVDVYDVRGRRVAHVFEGRLEGPGSHAFSLTDRSLASGVYWIRLAGDGFERSQRVTLLR